jgi:hypothetical protein
VLADPFDLAADALRPIAGFEYTDDDLSLRELNALDFRIVGLNGSLLADYVWSKAVSSDGDDLTLVSLYPLDPFRADPDIDLAIALAMADLEDPQEVAIGNLGGWRIRIDGDPWTLVADNTHVFLAIGDAAPSVTALEELVAANAPSYLWQKGDCLFFGDTGGGGVPYAPFGEGNLVPCDGAHTHEVITSLTLDAGPEAPFPGTDLSDRSFEECEIAFEDYLGIPEFPSDIAMIRYLPDGFEWDEGDRYLGCVIYLGDAKSDPITIDQPLEGIGDAGSRDIAVGDCTDLAGGPAVRCSRPHRFEYIGPAPLDLREGTYPGTGATETAATEACSDLLAGYATTPRIGDVSLEAFAVWFPGPAAWERGVREAQCVAWAWNDDDQLRLIMGSLADGWEPVRPPSDGGIEA